MCCIFHKNDYLIERPIYGLSVVASIFAWYAPLPYGRVLSTVALSCYMFLRSFFHKIQIIDILLALHIIPVSPFLERAPDTTVTPSLRIHCLHISKGKM